MPKYQDIAPDDWLRREQPQFRFSPMQNAWWREMMDSYPPKLPEWTAAQRESTAFREFQALIRQYLADTTEGPYREPVAKLMTRPRRPTERISRYHRE